MSYFPTIWWKEGNFCVTKCGKRCCIIQERGMRLHAPKNVIERYVLGSICLDARFFVSALKNRYGTGFWEPWMCVDFPSLVFAELFVATNNDFTCLALKQTEQLVNPELMPPRFPICTSNLNVNCVQKGRVFLLFFWSGFLIYCFFPFLLLCFLFFNFSVFPCLCFYVLCFFASPLFCFSSVPCFYASLFPCLSASSHPLLPRSFLLFASHA